MPANSTPAERSTRSLWTVVLLIFTLACVLLVVIGVLTKEINKNRASEHRSSPIEVIGLTVDSDVASASRVPAPREAMLLQTLRELLKELVKQAIDQPGHFLIAAIPIWLSHRLTGVPWYGWPVIPLLAYREWLQWPSNRWWDPPLDWAVLALGVIVATWALSSTRRAANAGPAIGGHQGG